MKTSINASACERCHNQKLRCSRENPTCDRCQRLGATCNYPDPSTRKRFARGEARPAKRVNVEGAARSINGRATVHEIESFPTTESENDVSISKHLAILLEDIYFSYAFHAKLIIYRPSYKQLRIEGKIPLHLEYSIRALATNWLEPLCQVAQKYSAELRPLSNPLISQQWALLAGEHVLKGIDNPTIEQVQSAHNLGIYWFCKGDFIRNSMFAGIAHRASRVLMSKHTGNAAQTGFHSLDAEIRNRCFWASFMAYSVNVDHYMIGSSADILIKQVPLPISRDNIDQQIWRPAAALNRLGDTSKTGQYSEHPNAFAEVQQLLHHWTRVRDHIERRKIQTLQDSVLELVKLNDWLDEYEVALHPQLKCTPENLLRQVRIHDSMTIFSIHSIFQHCRLVLDGSLVPAFGGKALDGIPMSLFRTCAKQCINAAELLSKLATLMLSIDAEPARCAPFLGHTMFVACNICITLADQTGELKVEALERIVPMIQVLQSMAPYWFALNTSWNRLKIVYEYHTAREVHEQDQTTTTLDEFINKRLNSAPATAQPLTDTVQHHSLASAITVARSPLVSSEDSEATTGTSTENLATSGILDPIASAVADAQERWSLNLEDWPIDLLLTERDSVSMNGNVIDFSFDGLLNSEWVL